MENQYRKFDFRLLQLEPQIVSALSEIDEMRGRLGAAFPSTISSALLTLRRSVIITSAGSSTRIEGSKLSDEEVSKIMQNLKVSKFEDRDSQEVQGYLETLQNIFDSYEILPLREATVISLHKDLLKYSVKDDLHRGSYKKKENIVGILDKKGNVAKVIFETTPAYLVSKEMQELVEWTTEALNKNRFHHLLVIANFIVEFLKIHPFEDGNGRLSRVLTNLLMLRSGYLFMQAASHEQVIEKRKDEYYFSLRKSQETFGKKNDNIAPWLNFFLSVIKNQAASALALFSNQNLEDALSLKQLEVWKYFLDVREASVGQIVQHTNIAHGTVRQAINKLLQKQAIKRLGEGRASRYVVLKS